MCCDSKGEVLVDGRSWSRSCRLAVGVVGVVGTFSLPFYLALFPMQIPIQSSVLSANDTVTSSVMFFLRWLVIVVTRYPQSPNRNQQASRHARISKMFFMFAIFRLQFFLSLLYCIFREFREYSRNSSSVMVFSNFFQFFDVLPLVFASPEDLCGSFFFFLNGSSFPSASILLRICSSAAPPRYCLPEMSFPIELLAVW